MGAECLRLSTRTKGHVPQGVELRIVTESDSQLLTVAYRGQLIDRLHTRYSIFFTDLLLFSMTD